MQKLENGRLIANPYDHLVRVVIVVSESKCSQRSPRMTPVKPVRPANTRLQSSVTSKRATIQRFDDLKGRHRTHAQGSRVAVLTDLDDLDRLGSAGELSFESLYARSR